jgi:hypothetical protein
MRLSTDQQTKQLINQQTHTDRGKRNRNNTYDHDMVLVMEPQCNDATWYDCMKAWHGKERRRDR